MSARKPPPVGDFRKLLERLTHRHDTRQVFDAFTRFAACALAAQTREAEYLEEVKRWEPADLVLFSEAFGTLVNEMEHHPFEDILAAITWSSPCHPRDSSGTASSTHPKPSATSWRKSSWVIRICLPQGRSPSVNRPAVPGR